MIYQGQWQQYIYFIFFASFMCFIIFLFLAPNSILINTKLECIAACFEEQKQKEHDVRIKYNKTPHLQICNMPHKPQGDRM